MRLRNPVAVAGELEPWVIALPVVVVGAGALAFGITQLLTPTSSPSVLPPGVVPPRSIKGVPFASGIHSPLWPVSTRHKKRGVVSYRDTHGAYHGNWSRRFGAPRGSRNHVGMDLYANAGDPVIAIADGIVTAMQSFHLGSWAMFVDHGPVVVMYGEIEKYSWRDYGATLGTRVRRGHPIARVACMRWEGNHCASHMLHLETYRPGTKKNKRWYAGARAPSAILDPSWLLLQAQPTA